MGPKRPVHSSVIPMGWVSMIRVHGEGDSENIENLIDLEDAARLEEEEDMAH